VVGQQTPPIGGWRVHLPYGNNKSICEVGSKLYIASASGIFTYDYSEKSIERLSRISGLSDVEVKIVRHNAGRNQTIVVYENSNIDIIDHNNNTITNIPDVLNQRMIGKKSVNNVCFYQNFAYLSSSFGIVVIDMNKKRVADSYQNLGDDGSQVEFFDLSVFKDTIFASATRGIYTASLSAINLNDYRSWSKTKISSYSSLSLVFNSKLYAVVDSILQVYDGSNWSVFAEPTLGLVKSMEISQGSVVMVFDDEIMLMQNEGNYSHKNHRYRTEALLNKQGNLCMIGSQYGLTIDNGSNELIYVQPNGPAEKTSGRMAYTNGKLWVTGGEVNERWDPLVYNNSKFSVFEDNFWDNYAYKSIPEIDGARDFIDVKVHPYNGKIYMSSFGTGIYELADGKVANFYDEKNSSLQRFPVPNYTPMLAGGMDFDAYGNLWVSNFGVTNPLSVFTGSEWKSFSVGTLLGGNEVGYVTCDDENNKWVLSTKAKGILVYNDNATPLNSNDDSYKLLNTEVGQGALPDNNVTCVTKDQRGEMWIGTLQGLAIISNPRYIFNNSNINYDARQIVIKTGLVYSNFLGTEIVNCITVDAANRKWIGTRNGVWLVSADGYTVLNNFTMANSPLLSNNVLQIGIHEKTGEVFMTTDKGIISYMGTATESAKIHMGVKIYPNPVTPEFNSLISITGLVANATVKITDISGNLVHETTSNGGMATWNGRNFNGRRVPSGIYVIFSADKTGVETFAGKILFIN